MSPRELKEKQHQVYAERMKALNKGQLAPQPLSEKPCYSASRKSSRRANVSFA
ncbi:hypothetical protein AB6T85_14325 [Erwinia sp. ACCC 02193]|jgi:hypothetical protein|uniref:Uncharacterized protein n=1 Tax=Erwinia aeris TaxID=3239803 RepID=A0ABV4E9T8_9GAMM|nr:MULTISPECIES: hypothetical protein [unclassified Erwinia]MDN4628334.1 hypothetical protein [Erwinia sp. PsM31]